MQKLGILRNTVIGSCGPGEPGEKSELALICIWLESMLDCSVAGVGVEVKRHTTEAGGSLILNPVLERWLFGILGYWLKKLVIYCHICPGHYLSVYSLYPLSSC